MEKLKLLKKKRKALEDGNLQQIAITSKNLGGYYNEKGLYELALSEFKDEAETYEKLDKKMDKAKSHRMIGEMYMLIGEFNKALQNEMIYLTTAREENDKIEEQRAYATIGRVHLLHGQSFSDLEKSLKPLRSAEKAFIKSLLICKDLTGKISRIELLDMQARLYLNLGVTKEHMENFEKSVGYTEKAIKICQANDFFELLHQCYITVGLLLHQKQNDSPKSLRFFNLALEVGERLQNKTIKVCETLMFKAEVLIKTGDFQSAKQILQRAYKMKTTDKNDGENIEKLLRIVAAMCYTEDSLMTTASDDYKSKKELYEKMGDGSCKLQSYSMAINYYLKMLEFAKLNKETGKDLIPIYVSLYQTFKDNKQFDLALDYLWMEFELCKDVPKEAFTTLMNIGEIYENAKKIFWDIDEIYQRARKEAKLFKNLKFEGIVLEKMISLRKSNDMSTMAEVLEEEAKSSGINLTNLEEEDGESIDSDTPDIGDDICLDDLSDSSSEPEISDKPNVLRKRGQTGIAIKKNSKGESQLHQACISGNLTLARRLVDQGHPLNVRDNAGWLPLHEACIHGHKDIVEIILDRGNNSLINDKGGTDCDGITPLYDACSNGHLEIIELLLDRGANATFRTDFGENCLSVLEKWKETVKLELFEVSFYDSLRSRIMKKIGGVTTDKSPLISGTTNPRSSGIGSSINSSITSSNHRNLRYAGNDYSDSDDEPMEIQKPDIQDNSTSDSVSSFENVTQIQKNAKFEYKSVMENLRTRHEQPISYSEKKNKRSAYLENAEVGEDWLDVDVVHTKKKQKIFNDQIMSPAKSNRQCVEPAVDSTSELILNISDEKTPDVDEDDVSIDAFDVLMNIENNLNSRKTKRLSLSCKNKSESGNGSRGGKQQSSLLTAGFCRFRSESPPVGITQPDSTSFLEKSPGPKLNTSIGGLSGGNVISAISVKVKVEEQLLLVPVSSNLINELNIGWLAEETARRYYNLKGLRPELRLMTSDGAVFEETDPISHALAASFISSTVLEWKLPPLAQRYLEACTLQKTQIDKHVNTLLELCQATQILALNDQELSLKTIQPVFKAILHQSSLMELNLSNNSIQDEGVKSLVLALPTLKNLKILNLSGNMITVEGIEHFCTNNSNINLALNDLDLSFNPLGNESLRLLAKLCNSLNDLTNLKISSCEITNFFDYSLNFQALHQLDLSYNNLKLDSICKVLSNLNSCHITSLNLSFCVNEEGIGEHIAAFLNAGTCQNLKELNLMSCNLNDADIWEIIRSIPKTIILETLKLTQNPQLTSITFKTLLNSKKVKYLKLIGCPKLLMDFIEVNQLSELEENVLPERIMLTLRKDDKLQQIERLKRMWEKCWGELWRIKCCDLNLVLFVDGDLKADRFKGFIVN